MQITPHIHQIRGMANQYLLIDQTEITLIDTGMASNTKNVLKHIKSLGLLPENLKRILITHSDPDHIGAVNALRQITGAKVFVSKIEADAMKTGASSREIHPKGMWILVYKLMSTFFTTQPIDVDEILEDREVLPILGGLQVLSSSGHTPGHLSFFLPEERILFAGDSIENYQGNPVPNLSALTGNPEEAQKSFDRQMPLNPLVIGCGHAYFDFRGKSNANH
jgi:glyoxylase-like metal-dependent hydrolase (beta-lactamase superfamily II)